METAPAPAPPAARAARAKIDADSLLAHQGLPHVLERAPGAVRLRGKGHEVDDLGRLLFFYRTWAHSLAPKLKFSAAVERVEKKCRERRMRVYLGAVIQQSNGRVTRHDTLAPGFALAAGGSDNDSDTRSNNNSPAFGGMPAFNADEEAQITEQLIFANDEERARFEDDDEWENLFADKNENVASTESIQRDPSEENDDDLVMQETAAFVLVDKKSDLEEDDEDGLVLPYE